MRTGNNIYKRKDGRFEARFKDGFKSDGKPKYRSVYAKTYKEVKEKLETIKRCNKDFKRSANIKFIDVVKEWLVYIKPSVKESTFALYSRISDNHIIPYLGGLKLTQITEQYLTAYINTLLERGNRKTKRGLSKKTVEDISMIVHSILTFANDRYQLNQNFKLPKIKVQEKKISFLSVGDQARLENWLLNNLDLIALGCFLSLYTGVRIGELCALKLKDFNFQLEVFSISKTLQRIKNTEPNTKSKTKIIIDTPKSNTSIRVLPIPYFLLEIIMKKFKGYSNECFFLTGSVSRYLEPRAVEHYFKQVTQKLNFENITFHSLRHTFATRLAENGADIKTLSELLGHASIRMTAKYMHTSEQRKKEVIKLFSSPINRQNFGVNQKESLQNEPKPAI